MEEEGSGLQALAREFFAGLEGSAPSVVGPPEKSEQTVRIKISSTPWVIPTTVDRRFSSASDTNQETSVPKLQRLHPAAASPLPASTTQPSPAFGGPPTKFGSGGAMVHLDPLRQPSQEAGRFDQATRITEDPSMLPIQPPPPPPTVKEPPKPAPHPAAALASPYPRKQIFLKSPQPTPQAPRSALGTRPSTDARPAPHRDQGFPSPGRTPMQMQSLFMSPAQPTADPTSHRQPSSMRKRVTFSLEDPSHFAENGADGLTPRLQTGYGQLPPMSPGQRSFLSPTVPDRRRDAGGLGY